MTPASCARGWVLHRLIRERRLGPGRPVVVASAGNAAVAAAYWCRLLELPCTVVVPASTAAAKIELIRAEAADVVPHAPPAGIYDEARRICQVTGGFYLDHFTQGPAAATEPSWQLAHQVVGAVEAATGEPPTTVVAGLGSGATGGLVPAEETRPRGVRRSHFDTSSSHSTEL